MRLLLLILIFSAHVRADWLDRYRAGELLLDQGKTEEALRESCLLEGLAGQVMALSAEALDRTRVASCLAPDLGQAVALVHRRLFPPAGAVRASIM